MIVLDTNLISELMKSSPDAHVATWMQRTPETDLLLCDVVVMELSFGAEQLLCRTGSSRYTVILQNIRVMFRDRMLSFNPEVALLTGRLRARREGMGRPISLPDAMIAAICLYHGATLATRNVKDFEGLDLKLVNPFEGAQ
ncbi:MAG TPA: type II toxin-antitoxin system VapC family toxin [Mycoplana sp.]|nr:type II toxin-antitoxin system VapC family toxin [Mycoplana sp.]